MAVLSSCRAYKQDIMFRLDKDFTEDDLSEVKTDLEGNYVLKPNDVFLLDVFTNNGELLIDPNMEMMEGNNMMMQQQQMFRDRFQYIIQVDGTAILPIVGTLKLEGMTMFEAEQFLVEKFDDVYKGAFVKLRMTNRRVFVLGTPGGMVIPINNENTSLIEVLAASEGLELGARAQNIKVIRGDEVYLVNLSTISGMQASNMNVEPGDVIYIEPWRRPWLETLRDVSPALSLVSSVLTLIVVVQNL